MTRDQKWAWIIFALALIAAPALYVIGSNLTAKLAEENFYRAHPMLNEMRAGHKFQGTDPNARDVLLGQDAESRMDIGSPSSA